MVSGDGDSVGNLADDVQLLDADLVNLIEDVDAGNVGSVTLHHINKFIRCSITPVEKTIKLNPNKISIICDQIIKVPAAYSCILQLIFEISWHYIEFFALLTIIEFQPK